MHKCVLRPHQGLQWFTISQNQKALQVFAVFVLIGLTHFRYKANQFWQCATNGRIDVLKQERWGSLQMARHPASIFLMTSIDWWNSFLCTLLLERNAILCFTGKPLTPQPNQITYLPEMLLSSVKYGLFLAVEVMECVLTGSGENTQFTAKLEVQPMCTRNTGRL